jgi:hypothetical protein
LEPSKGCAYRIAVKGCVYGTAAKSCVYGIFGGRVTEFKTLF